MTTNETTLNKKILNLCVQGYSNKTIANKLGISILYSSRVLTHYFGFLGWREDLDINPLSIYNNSNGLSDFIEKVELVSPYLEKATIVEAFRICMLYKRKELKNYE